MLPLFNRAKEVNTFFAAHTMLNAVAHSCAGFGLAVVLQHYLKGNAFLPVYVGWGLVLVSVVMHVYPLVIQKK